MIMLRYDLSVPTLFRALIMNPEAMQGYLARRAVQVQNSDFSRAMTTII
jgi:hypothetical protein